MKTKFPLKVFVVNLVKDIRKLQHMESICSSNELEYEIFPAVNGKELPSDEINKYYSEKMAISKLGRKLTLGEIGCSLSHINIYKRIVKENVEVSLILEDDIEFTDNPNIIYNLAKEFPANWDVVLIGHHNGDGVKNAESNFWYKKNIGSSNFFITKPALKAFGTYAYFISLNGAKKMIAHLNIFFQPIDHYIGNSFYSNLYIVTPCLVKPTLKFIDNSNIKDERDEINKQIMINYDKKNLIRKIYISISSFLKVRSFLNSLFYNIILFYKKFKPFI